MYYCRIKRMSSLFDSGAGGLPQASKDEIPMITPRDSLVSDENMKLVERNCVMDYSCMINQSKFSDTWVISHGGFYSVSKFVLETRNYAFLQEIEETEKKGNFFQFPSRYTQEEVDQFLSVVYGGTWKQRLPLQMNPLFNVYPMKGAPYLTKPPDDDDTPPIIVAAAVIPPPYPLVCPSSPLSNEPRSTSTPSKPSSSTSPSIGPTPAGGDKSASVSGLVIEIPDQPSYVPSLTDSKLEAMISAGDDDDDEFPTLSGSKPTRTVDHGNDPMDVGVNVPSSTRASNSTDVTGPLRRVPVASRSKGTQATRSMAPPNAVGEFPSYSHYENYDGPDFWSMKAEEIFKLGKAISLKKSIGLKKTRKVLIRAYLYNKYLQLRAQLSDNEEEEKEDDEGEKDDEEEKDDDVILVDGHIAKADEDDEDGDGEEKKDLIRISSKEELTIKLNHLVLQHECELSADIYKYEPVSLTRMRNVLTKHGFKTSDKHLQDYLDEQAVTYTTADEVKRAGSRRVPSRKRGRKRKSTGN